MAVTVKYRRQGLYSVTGSGGRSAALRFGADAGAMPSDVFSLTNGTASNQADQIYYYPISLAATTGVSLDLKGGGGELDVLGAALAMVEVRWFYVWISTTPATTVSLRFGPQNITDAWQGPFSALTATYYLTVNRTLEMDSPADGATNWAVGASTKVLRLYNPGAATVAGGLLVAGCKT